MQDLFLGSFAQEDVAGAAWLPREGDRWRNLPGTPCRTSHSPHHDQRHTPPLSIRNHLSCRPLPRSCEVLQILVSTVRFGLWEQRTKEKSRGFRGFFDPSRWPRLSRARVHHNGCKDAFRFLGFACRRKGELPGLSMNAGRVSRSLGGVSVTGGPSRRTRASVKDASLQLAVPGTGKGRLSLIAPQRDGAAGGAGLCSQLDV